MERLIPPRKPGLAFSLGAMGSRQHNFYNDAYRRAGYADAATEVQRLWLDGRRDEADGPRARRAGAPDQPARHRRHGARAPAAYQRAGITTLRVEPGGEGLAARLATLGRLLDLVRALR